MYNASVILHRACPCTTKFLFGEPNTPTALRRRDACHLKQQAGHGKITVGIGQDTEKQITFPDYVGRCNHEQKCGYNYTPKMYLDEKPIAKKRLNEEFVPVSKPRISLPPEPSFIEPEIMRQS